MVRKKLSAREGRGWLSGTLFCTHFRVAFMPQDSPKPDVRPSAQLLDSWQQNPSSHVLFSPCHAGQCRPGASGGSRRGFGLYWEGGGGYVKLHILGVISFHGLNLGLAFFTAGKLVNYWWPMITSFSCNVTCNMFLFIFYYDHVRCGWVMSIMMSVRNHWHESVQWISQISAMLFNLFQANTPRTEGVTFSPVLHQFDNLMHSSCFTKEVSDSVARGLDYAAEFS